MKPHDLIARIIKASSNEGDLVLDCFSGSGSVAIVAKGLCRNFICSDFNSDYVRISSEMLEDMDDKLI